jgi:hypothetical protein
MNINLEFIDRNTWIYRNITISQSLEHTCQNDFDGEAYNEFICGTLPESFTVNTLFDAIKYIDIYLH